MLENVLMELILPLLCMLTVLGLVVHACMRSHHSEEDYWNIMGLILVWPLWFVIKITKGIFRGLKKAITS